ncbi:MAG: rhodanese-like domain-containing protein, partial [Candidatus Electrothrix sp. AR4]|nr:rhodanese-like domain-containing protein [Candidatus Electrothrix sp. AR4]
MKKNVLLIVAIFLFTCAGSTLAADVEIIGKEELKAKLTSFEFTILDVRSEAHWEASDNKIPGAIRLPGDKIDVWAENFHKTPN